jgi:hypothetical protein
MGPPLRQKEGHTDPLPSSKRTDFWTHRPSLYNFRTYISLAARSCNKWTICRKYSNNSERPTLNSIRIDGSSFRKKRGTWDTRGKAVREWQTPKSKYELRSFLGLCTYYKRYISDIADTGKLLIRLTEESQVIQWPPEVETAFQSLREAICTLLVLGCLQPGEQFVDNTDVRNVGIGWLSV